jgi:hypothetical protein
MMNLKTTMAVLMVSLAFAGCGGSPVPQETSPSVAVDRQEADAERAKAALIALVRGNPGLFEGHPDPDKLQGLPLEESESGTYRLGRFQIDVTKRSYSALIGNDQTAVLYRGPFETSPTGQWMSGKPEISPLRGR